MTSRKNLEKAATHPAAYCDHFYLFSVLVPEYRYQGTGMWCFKCCSEDLLEPIVSFSLLDFALNFIFPILFVSYICDSCTDDIF